MILDKSSFLTYPDKKEGIFNITSNLVLLNLIHLIYTQTSLFLAFHFFYVRDYAFQVLGVKIM